MRPKRQIKRLSREKEKGPQMRASEMKNPARGRVGGWFKYLRV